MKAATPRMGYGRMRIKISIHAAREGGDPADSPVKPCTLKFQSTPPVKAATDTDSTLLVAKAISIHAAREGGDCGNE